MTIPLFLFALLPLQFHSTPLGNVTRVLSARFHTQIGLSAGGKAAAPITANCDHLSLAQCLDVVARQTGLQVVPTAQGYLLRLPPAADSSAALAAAAARRAQLLQQRAKLEAQAQAQAEADHAD